MRNHCLVAVGVALVMGFTIAEAGARPGGRRVAPRAGGTRSGNVRPGNITPDGQLGQGGIRNLGDKLQSTDPQKLTGNQAGGNFQNKVSQLKTNFTPANQPFTPAWYAGHPRAWQYTHPHADAWAVATFGVAAGWLGLGAAGGTVYTSETVDSDAAGDFLPLGVFAMAPKSERDASALVQLALNQQGDLRGNYYDVLTGQDQVVAGTVDKTTRRATFQVGPGGKVAFETTLASLTRPTGSVTLRFQDGRTRQWTLARFDDPAPSTPDTKR
jgi:hypothetical protein